MLDLKGAGGVPHFADLRGRGEKDLVMLQAPGMYWVWHHMPTIIRMGRDQKKPGYDHFCLTAFSPRGETLWQIEKPWQKDIPFWTHSAERTLTFADVDGDGTDEMLVLRRQYVVVIRPDSGEIVAEHKLPEENIEILVAGRTGPGPRDWAIFAGVSNQGRQGRPGNPGFFFDADFKLIETRDFYHAGHAPQAVDLDGDGFHEWLIGYEYLDNDLSLRWRFDADPHFPPDDTERHVDAMDYGRFEDDGPFMIAYAASDIQFVVNDQGELVFKARRTHPQQCFFGRFLPEREGEYQLFVLNKRAELDLFDKEGNVIWSVVPEENWPMGKPKPFQEGMKFHLFDPSHVLPGTGTEGSDLILYLETGWPYIIDGHARRYAELEHTPEIRQDYPWTAGRPDDQGYGFLAVTDEHDDHIRVVLADRRYAWEYEIPKQCRHPAAPAVDGR